jgi:hypothetical protein
MTLLSRLKAWVVVLGSLTTIALGFGLIMEGGGPLETSSQGAQEETSDEDFPKNEEACIPVMSNLMAQARDQIPRDEPRSVSADVRSIARGVEAIRGLKFKKVPTPKFLSAGELSQRVGEDVLSEYPDEEASLDSKLLALVGGVPRGTDVKEVFGEAYSEGVAGFYDDETGEIVMRSLNPGERLDAEDRLVLAHELDHALTDQALGLPDFGDEPKPEQDDLHFASDGLVEGDATLVGYAYGFAAFEGSNPEELFGGEASQDVISSLPHYLERAITFPYDEGALFVCHLYQAGGWEAVNQAYRDLPKSTARVLFPSQHPAEEVPADPADSGKLAAPWEFVEKRGFGAADVLWLFQAPGGETSRSVASPRSHSVDWAGGEMTIWKKGEGVALGISLIQRDGGAEMCNGVNTWYARSFEDDRAAKRLKGEKGAFSGEAQSAVILCQGTNIRVGIGPDLETARALINAPS